MIPKLIIKTEINNKYKVKTKVRKELKKSNNEISNVLSYVTFQALKYRIRKRLTQKKENWLETHNRKLENLRREIPPNNKHTTSTFAPNVIHNFSSYILSKREKEVLSYTLDHYVPFKLDVKRIEVEFEKLYQSITPHTTHLDSLQKSDMKSKFLGIFHRYSKVKQKPEDDDVIKNLAKNKKIVILRRKRQRRSYIGSFTI